MEDKERTIFPSPANAGNDTPATGGMPQAATCTSIEINLAGDGGAVTGAGGGGGSGGMGMDMEVKNKKRGRPRKCHESMMFPMSPGCSTSPSVASPKRGRGRPLGSGKLQLLASLGGFAAETAGAGFTAHVMTVHAGEDVFGKILSISQRGPRAVCILSASGVVSSVIIRQPGSSDSTLRYEGRFEILSLSGSFAFGKMSGACRKNGMLSVSLAKPDGRVFGGAVAGSLIAAGPIQLVVGSFKKNTKKELQSSCSAKSSMAAGMPGNSDVVRVPVPIAKMTNGDENCLTLTSALSEPAHGGAGNIVINDQNLNGASLHSVGWNASQPSEPMLDQMTSPNINASVPEI